MQITCPRCQSRHEIELPATARARAQRSLKFRCSHCGHTFNVDPTEALGSRVPAGGPALAVAAAAVAPVLQEPPPLGGDRVSIPRGEAILQVQVAGQIWPVPDHGTLLRWVLERRLDRDSLVADRSGQWARAGAREDLALFFTAADALSVSPPVGERTEIPLRMDEDIIVDAMEADPEPVMPVRTGPGPAAPHAADFGQGWGPIPREDTQEQTVRSMGVDEAPVVPANFDVAEKPERTERMRVAPPPPLPSAIDARFGLTGETVSPGPAPRDSLAARTAPATVVVPPSVEPAPAPQAAPQPAPPPPGAARDVAPVHRGPDGAPSRGPTVRAPTGGPPPSAPINPSVSQTFYQDGPAASPTPQAAALRDIFEDPPTGNVGGASRAGWYVAAVGLLVLAAVGYLLTRGDGKEPKAVARTTSVESVSGTSGLQTSSPGVEPGAPGTVGAGEGSTAATNATGGSEVPPAAPAKEPASVGTEPVAVKEPVATVAGDPPAGRPATKDAAKAAAVKPAAKPAGGGRKLIPEAWDAVGANDFESAYNLFDRAIQEGGGGDALYGRGYASEKMGDKVSALTDYCKALPRVTSTDIRREIEGGLRRLDKQCP